jgi:hypothetical protein
VSAPTVAEQLQILQDAATEQRRIAEQSEHQALVDDATRRASILEHIAANLKNRRDQ